ncbi:hypothetical protein OBBRIDRAFT_789312 [Obba rivulosa]|uniref:Uncharacterized protein n=1 Tax=Obba rivulosa TaxID=1052685 RepID=A0A8E2J462_9APHY|nr:hypothetical protein OBBRIDRAFT_789312 [Obba rivulosa]
MNPNGPSVGFSNDANNASSLRFVSISSLSRFLILYSIYIRSFLAKTWSTLISYKDTTLAAGPVLLANIVWGDFTVENQAFINAVRTNANDFGRNNDLIGIGLTWTSRIWSTL